MTEPDQNVDNAARNMIERFGSDAVGEIDQRIAELEVHGQKSARNFWISVRQAVLRMTGSPGETRH